MVAGRELFGIGEVETVLCDHLAVAREAQASAEQEGFGDLEVTVVSPGGGEVRVTFSQQPFRRGQGPCGLPQEGSNLLQAALTPSLRTFSMNGSAPLR
jgi:hypothetical protein